MLWLLKLLHPLVLDIRGGKVSPVKGRLPSSVTREIQALVSEAGIDRATIHVDGSGRFHFSSAFPQELHQRLRNLLANL